MLEISESFHILVISTRPMYLSTTTCYWLNTFKQVWGAFCDTTWYMHIHTYLIDARCGFHWLAKNKLQGGERHGFSVACASIARENQRFNLYPFNCLHCQLMRDQYNNNVVWASLGHISDDIISLSTGEQCIPTPTSNSLFLHLASYDYRV